MVEKEVDGRIFVSVCSFVLSSSPPMRANGHVDVLMPQSGM